MDDERKLKLHKDQGKEYKESRDQEEGPRYSRGHEGWGSRRTEGSG